jgi:hypothetical protein
MPPDIIRVARMGESAELDPWYVELDDVLSAIAEDVAQSWRGG